MADAKPVYGAVRLPGVRPGEEPFWEDARDEVERVKLTEARTRTRTRWACRLVACCVVVGLGGLALQVLT